MTNEKLREIMSEIVGGFHGNKEFVRQIRDGEQDDGPYMVAAFGLRDWYEENMAFVAPTPESMEG